MCGFKTSMSADVDCKPGKTTTLGFNTGLALKLQAAHKSSLTWFFLCCHDKVEWTTAIPVCVWGGAKKKKLFVTIEARIMQQILEEISFVLSSRSTIKKKKNTYTYWGLYVNESKEAKRHTPQMLTQYYYKVHMKIHERTKKCCFMYRKRWPLLTITVPDTYYSSLLFSGPCCSLSVLHALSGLEMHDPGLYLLAILWSARKNRYTTTFTIKNLLLVLVWERIIAYLIIKK